MAQNTPIMTWGQPWNFLEPAIEPAYAREDHVKVPAAAGGTTVTYSIGQILRQKDDGTNEFAKQGTAGYTGPVRVVKHAFVVNDAGKYQDGTSWVVGAKISENSRNVYRRGYFKTQDLVGLTSDAVMNAVGELHRGTRASGIIHIGGGVNALPA